MKKLLACTLLLASGAAMAGSVVDNGGQGTTPVDPSNPGSIGNGGGTGPVTGNYGPSQSIPGYGQTETHLFLALD